MLKVTVPTETQGHLVLVCDICPGQKKNRVVIQFVVWLVENPMYKKVTLVFLKCAQVNLFIVDRTCF